MNEKINELVTLLAAECKTMDDVQNLLRELFKGTIEKILNSEMDCYLKKEDNIRNNSRNGYNKKMLQSQFGKIEIRIPRDRNGKFVPQVIGKYQTKTEHLENLIIDMYAKGMSNREIETHLRDMYGIGVSASLVSKITDKIMPDMIKWQNRPLDGVYPIVVFDGLAFKLRSNGKVVGRYVFSALGISKTGRKDVLGIWMTENGGFNFWMDVCGELRRRGVQDILIACRDNITGFSEAIKTVFPKTEQQLCIPHLIHESTKDVAEEDLDAVAANLKQIFNAGTIDEARRRLEDFRRKWDNKYPLIADLCAASWNELTNSFKFPYEIRNIIYSSNAAEDYYRMVRKLTKSKTIFPTEDAMKKSIYLSIREISKKLNAPVKGWDIILAQLRILFEGRIAA
jgi:transposase-like protein